jgi:hypothetical protein
METEREAGHSRCEMQKLLLLALLPAMTALAQRPIRFSLQTELLDLTNCLAQPGNVPIPLSPTNTNIEILDWTTKPGSSNQPGEFLIKFKRPTYVGSFLQYEGGEVSVERSNQWRVVPAPFEAGRKLQIVALPSGEQFTALKVVVPAEKTNGLYHARLPFATMIPVRAINIGPTAKATASSLAPKMKPEMLIDGIIDPQKNFSTAAPTAGASGEKPWVMLTWPAPQKIRGLGFFRGTSDEGFEELLIEAFPPNGDARPSPVSARSTPPGKFCSDQFAVMRQMQETASLRFSPTGTVTRLALGEIIVIQDLGTSAAPAVVVSSAPKSYTIAHVAPGAIKIDGDDSDWPAERIDGFALRYDDDNLYVLFKGQGTFENKGTNFLELFHTGDAIDVMLQTRSHGKPDRLDPTVGDIRLLLAMFQGKPVCVLYNFRSADFVGKSASFKSPTNTVWCDQVEFIGDAQIEVKRRDGEFTFEASVPLRSINTVPSALPETQGDVGRILGDATGTHAVQRVYWSNKNLPPMGELANEAMIQPASWGILKFAE